MNYFGISDHDLVRSFQQEVLQLDEVVGENDEGI